MPNQIVISENLRIAAVLNDEKVEELIVAQGRYQIGDIYLGTVENVLPGIDAAFVNIGESEKNGFIHVTDLGPLRLKKGSFGITELLEPRQKVLVQVMKEPTGTKGPRLTGNVSLPGRYLVIQPHGQGVNISRKINSEGERNRLRALGVLVKPPGSGLLIRSEATGVSEELLIDDLENLLKQWDAIQQASENSNPPVLLSRDEDFIQRVLRDHIEPTIKKVTVESAFAAERVNKFLANNEGSIIVESHPDPNFILESFRINAAIQDALRPRVDLPSGGYIIIEPTEALTVIDVNSGSFTRSANARETVLWTNCEAALEIARQLKLRNIGGVIIIDFIDMETRKDQLQLLEHFTSAIKNDSARPQIAQLTELGLVELTRKRQGQNIYELFGQTCPNCYGHGHIAILPGESNLEPMAIASGLVKSTDLSKADSIENANIRKKKIIKNGNKYNQEIVSQTIDDSLSSIESSSAANDTPESNQGNDISNQANRYEPTIIGVNMNQIQEEVFSLLGLNPILLNESMPDNDNYIIRIVRPEEDMDIVLEESRKQIEANSKKPRRRGRNINTRFINKTSIENNSNSIEEEEGDDDDNNENHNNLSPTKTLDSNNSENEEKLVVIEVNESISPLKDQDSSEKSREDKTEESEDPRRRRRRSSATATDE